MMDVRKAVGDWLKNQPLYDVAVVTALFNLTHASWAMTTAHRWDAGALASYMTWVGSTLAAHYMGDKNGRNGNGNGGGAP